MTNLQVDCVAHDGNTFYDLTPLIRNGGNYEVAISKFCWNKLCFRQTWRGWSIMLTQGTEFLSNFLTLQTFFRLREKVKYIVLMCVVRWSVIQDAQQMLLFVRYDFNQYTIALHIFHILSTDKFWIVLKNACTSFIGWRELWTCELSSRNSSTAERRQSSTDL